MPYILVIYTTLRGRTGEMVAPICAGIHGEGIEARARAVEEVIWEEMQAAARCTAMRGMSMPRGMGKGRGAGVSRCDGLTMAG
jgi:hypothetical protein